MKTKALALLLILAMVCTLLPTVALAADDPLALPAEPTSVINVVIGDESVAVSVWEDIVYVGNPTDIYFHFPPIPGTSATETTQLLNIYAPANANEGSPVILMTENGGWFTNTKPIKLSDGDVLPANGGKTAAIGEALKSGYVVVTYICRGRNDSPNDGEYLGHSPATMTDTKAVIRYLRYNDDVIPGDSEKMVVTGTSGGGALTSIICASGDSPDYYPSLYELGAAGMTSATTSVISDAVFAAIAYCPITDLPNADQAYEYIYGAVREAYKADGLTLEDINPNPGAMGAPESTDQVFGDSVLAASAELAADYAKYIDGLGLKDESGETITADSFKGAIQALLEKSVEKALDGIEAGYDFIEPVGDYTWLTVDDGKVTIDMDGYLYWIGTEMTGLKTAPAFSNRGTPNQHPQLNEDNIFGTKAQAYSPFEFWSWNNHIGEEAGVGKNNTGLDWDAYMETDEGKALALQLKMTNPIPYLTSAEGDSAPYWYVRHGMADRDTSFAVGSLLYYALLGDSSIEDVNFSFAWLKPHGGDYDVPEAYAWLADIMAANGYVPTPAEPAEEPEEPAEEPEEPAEEPEEPAEEPEEPAEEPEVPAEEPEVPAEEPAPVEEPEVPAPAPAPVPAPVPAINLDQLDPNVPLTQAQVRTVLQNTLGVDAAVFGSIKDNVAATRIGTAGFIAKSLAANGVSRSHNDFEINKILAPFSDLLGKGAGERRHLATCVELGIFVGNGDGTINPNGGILPAQMKVIIDRIKAVK